MQHPSMLSSWYLNNIKCSVPIRRGGGRLQRVRGVTWVSLIRFQPYQICLWEQPDDTQSFWSNVVLRHLIHLVIWRQFSKIVVLVHQCLSFSAFSLSISSLTIPCLKNPSSLLLYFRLWSDVAAHTPLQSYHETDQAWVLLVHAKYQCANIWLLRNVPSWPPLPVSFIKDADVSYRCAPFTARGPTRFW